MNFNSTPDCLLFVARVAAAAEYVIITKNSNSALTNAQDLKIFCAPFLKENGISFSFSDDVIQGVTATVFWPENDMTPLGDEPSKWAVQLTAANWENSPLKKDFELAVRHLMA